MYCTYLLCNMADKARSKVVEISYNSILIIVISLIAQQISQPLLSEYDEYYHNS